MPPKALAQIHMQEWHELGEHLAQKGDWLKALGVAVDAWSKHAASEQPASTSSDSVEGATDEASQKLKSQVESFILRYVDISLSSSASSSGIGDHTNFLSQR